MSDFFDEMTIASDIKATIVEKYFFAWSRIMKAVGRVEKIGYIDLFCGPGRYEDGRESTPLKILRQCLCDNVLCQKTRVYFNDANKEYADRLQAEIDGLEGIERMASKPIVGNNEVNEDFTQAVAAKHLIPCLSFIDPWGYKGLSLKLINSLAASWGSDVVFFFNYNRVNTAIRNPKVEDHINALFGKKNADMMRGKVGNLSPKEREDLVLKQLASVIKSGGPANFVLPFRFVSRDKNKTSHYIVFLTKDKTGHKIMKEIMWKASSSSDDGVANYSYVPDVYLPTEPMYFDLFEDAKPLDQLGDELLLRYAGNALTVGQIYDMHNPGSPYVLSNYKVALRRLEQQGRIKARPPAEVRPMRKGVITLANDTVITFPRIR